MKKNLLLLSSTLFIILALISSCNTEKACDNCPLGTTCINDMCVTIDPCEGITCDPGQECVNGNCQDLQVNCNTVNVEGTITTNTTWTNDNIYVLKGKVDIASGITLTINAGTIVKGDEGVEVNATALIVARNAKLIANGTASEPIIFTTVLDNITCGQKTGTNLDETSTGKWGGIIMLGNAPISAADGDTESQIEGLPGNEVYGKYGGSNAADNSGSLKYVSIRHGGALIGDGNEINGLTLGGVGSGTVIENIEVIANLDDGIEFFGGTVNVKNAIIGFQGDDAIDVDQNYGGTVDNFYIIHGGDDTDEALELDGPEGTLSDGLFTLKNGTCVALDIAKASPADLKSKSQGTIDNVTFIGYQDKPLRVRVSVNSDCSDKDDSWTYFMNGKMKIINSLYVGNVTAAGALKSYVNADASNPADADKIACFNNNTAKYEGPLDLVFGKDGNKISTTISGGADKSVFSWSWLAINNKIN